MEERTFFTKRNRKLDAISISWVFCFFKNQVWLVWESLWVEECPLSFYTPLLTARVQDLGLREIPLWGGKYVKIPRTQKLRTHAVRNGLKALSHLCSPCTTQPCTTQSPRWLPVIWILVSRNLRFCTLSVSFTLSVGYFSLSSSLKTAFIMHLWRSWNLSLMSLTL